MSHIIIFILIFLFHRCLSICGRSEDKIKGAVVVTVRGTLSLEDAITDVTADVLEVRACVWVCVCVRGLHVLYWDPD